MNKLFLLGALVTASLFKAQVGIGTSNPNNSAILELQSTNKGFLPPRMSLLNETDGITIPSPANGLVVYHTGTTINGPGLYTNLGTPALPKWALVQTQSSSTQIGFKILSFSGPADPTKTVISGNLEFRVNSVSGNFVLQTRMLKAPTGTVTYNSINPNSTVTLTFTPSNWSQWQTYNSAGENGAYSAVFLSYLHSNQDIYFYETKIASRYGSWFANTDKYFDLVYTAYKN